MNGWISIHRSIETSREYQEKPFCPLAAWIDLILQAKWKAEMVGGIEIPRGGLLITYSALAHRWGWSKSKVQRRLARWKADTQIDTRAIRDCTLIRITNYERYQEVLDDRETPPIRECSEIDTPIDNNINKRSIKNKEQVIGSPSPLDGLQLAIGFNEEARQALLKWLEYRREIKKPIKSKQTIQGLVDSYAQRSAEFVAAVKFSIKSGYQGLIEPDKNRNGYRKETNLDRGQAELARLLKLEEQEANTIEAEAYETF